MKLTIIGLLRPKMNLLTEDGQLSHLIEHLLANHERMERHGWRRRWHADRIVAQNAFVNNHFGAEFAVVPTSRADEMLALLTKMATDFDFTDEEIERERRVIVEELAADKTTELSMGEQFERACYVNPRKRRFWDDRELRQPLRREDVIKAARRRAGEFYPFSISQSAVDGGGARLPYLSTTEFIDFGGRARDLRHPKMNEGRSAVLLSIPSSAEEQSDPAQHLLTQLLRNIYFGYLTEVLRHREGLVYSLALGNTISRGTYDISFLADRAVIRERANYVLDLIAGDECAQWIRDNLALAKRARQMASELAWLNPADFAGSEISHVVMAGDVEPMNGYLQRIKNVTADQVIAARDRIIARRAEARLVIRSHGSKLSARWIPGLG